MQLNVERTDAGRRIDQWLADVPGVGSRSAAERLLRDGLVLVNGRAAAKSLRLRPGDEVAIDDAALVPPAPRSYAAAPVTVLLEDDDIVVIDKPTGMIVHPAPGNPSVSLVELLEGSGVPLAPNTDADMYRPGVVHRLDKDTSGVMVFAKRPAALRALQQSLHERTARREYLALVRDAVPSRAGRIEAPIGPDSREPSRRSIDTDKPKGAVTHFVVNEILPTTTLLRLRLETGRTHQIRVHLQAIGHPVVGDRAYGDAGEDYGLTRQFLHAAKLSFPHPRSGEQVEVTSPLPDDLSDALAQARRG